MRGIITASLALALAAAPISIGATGCATTQSAGEQLDDNTISRRVGSRLTASPEVRRYQIDVDSVDKVVTLRGEVSSQQDKETAEYIARNTEGVRDVRSLLTVRDDDDEGTQQRQSQQEGAQQRDPNRDSQQQQEPGQWETSEERYQAQGEREDQQPRGGREEGQPADVTLHSKIVTELAADPTVKQRNVDVDVDDGVVTLLGIVESEQAKRRAEEIAKKTKGVREVRNMLQVEQQRGSGSQQ